MGLKEQTVECMELNLKSSINSVFAIPCKETKNHSTSVVNRENNCSLF